MGQTEKDLEKIENVKQEYRDVQMSETQITEMRRRISEAKKEKRIMNKKYTKRNIVAAAAAIAMFVVLPNTSENVAHAMEKIPVLGKVVEVVTFREYDYEDERNVATVTVPEIEVHADNAGRIEGKDVTANTIAQETVKDTAEEINAEIQEIADAIIVEFEDNLKEETGYQEVLIEHEIVATSEEYFTLKLICYEAAGSGAQWNYFYTIDLTTGEKMTLENLFVEGADYITPISENIKIQMREQMKADEMVCYWLNDPDIPEGNFETITDETAFYLNEDGNVVIAFNEGDVAPMYMGCVEFIIEDEAIAEIRK